MRPIIDIVLESQVPEVQHIIAEALRIIEQISAKKVDTQKTKVDMGEDGAIRIQVIPTDHLATGVDMYLYSADNIIVGVSHGAHEHFDSAFPGRDIGTAAIIKFRDLIYAEQTTTVRMRRGKPYS